MLRNGSLTVAVGGISAWSDRARVALLRLSGGVGGRVWLVWPDAPAACVFSPVSLQGDAATCVCFYLLQIRSELEVSGSFRCVPLLRWRECCSRHRGGVWARVRAGRVVSHELRGLLCLARTRTGSGR